MLLGTPVSRQCYKAFWEVILFAQNLENLKKFALMTNPPNEQNSVFQTKV